jgi:multidrug efflux pump subunit AcrA (membrane-fusion protein)
MRSMTRAAGLAAGMVAVLSIGSAAQQAAPGAGRAARSPGSTIVVEGMLDWLEKSDVTALREGVIEQIEFQVGDRVEAGAPIGYLHRKLAELSVEKAKVAAESTGALKKAEAQYQVMLAKLARLRNIARDNRSNVSRAEMQEAEADVAMADGMVQEARDNIRLAEAELALMRQTLDEHTIYAPPFTGYVTDRMKGPNESLRASEAVLRIGRTDKLRFHGALPLEGAARVKVGDLVEFRPAIEEAELPIEQRVFTGRVRALAREVTTVGRTEIVVLGEVDNPEDPEHPELELRSGMKGEMTIFLGGAKPAPVANRPAATTTAR